MPSSSKKNSTKVGSKSDSTKTKTVMASKTNSTPMSSAGLVEEPAEVELKTASAPIRIHEETKLKVQVSAPSYLRSLAENNLPPFQKPEKETRPILLVGGLNPLVSEGDIVNVIAASDADPQNGMRIYLAQLLVNIGIIKGYELSERNFLVKLLMETIDYAAQRDFTAYKLACLFTVYLTVHRYFKWYYWSPPSAIWSYFKELMIRHTIQDSPDGQEVFTPDECYDIVSHFHTMYIMNLPLVHIATFGSYRVKLGWPFRLK